MSVRESKRAASIAKEWEHMYLCSIRSASETICMTYLRADESRERILHDAATEYCRAATEAQVEAEQWRAAGNRKAEIKALIKAADARLIAAKIYVNKLFDSHVARDLEESAAQNYRDAGLNENRIASKLRKIEKQLHALLGHDKGNKN